MAGQSLCQIHPTPYCLSFERRFSTRHGDKRLWDAAVPASRPDWQPLVSSPPITQAAVRTAPRLSCHLPQVLGGQPLPPGRRPVTRAELLPGTAGPARRHVRLAPFLPVLWEVRRRLVVSGDGRLN